MSDQNRNSLSPRMLIRHPEWVRNDLKSYIDEEITGVRRLLLSRHITRCRSCAEELRELERVSKDLRELPQANPRPELRARILASLPDALPSRIAPTASPVRNLPIRSRTPRFAFGGAIFAASLASAFALGRLSGPFKSSSTSSYTRSMRDQSGMPLARSGRPDRLHGETSGDTTPQKSVPNNDRYVYQDQTSIDANRILIQETIAETRFKKQNQEIAKQRLLQTNNSSYGAGTMEDPARLALTATDPASMSDRLQGAAQKLGASITPIIGANSASKSFHEMAVANTPLDIPAAGASVPGHLLLVRVPMSHAADFQRSLIQIASQSSTDSARSARHNMPRQSGSGPGSNPPLRGGPVRIASPLKLHSAIMSDETMAPPISNQHQTVAEPVLIYLIWLHPSASSPSH